MSPTGEGPSLWRTCRVLANRTRLRILGYLTAHPDHAVMEVARALDLSASQASQYLRALNARGLLQARRESGRVTYRLYPDPAIPFAAPLLRALEHTFAAEKDPIECIFRGATAFTHVRRHHIVHALRDGGLGWEELRRRTGIPLARFSSHFRKLVARGFVEQHGAVYSLSRPHTRLARTLLKLVLAQ